ncbi:hypothetical protein EDL98_01495 [Ornithobacterium rhinotracheale]|uniref:hypothetical protein n=1 Tax=Ornithobacterium rhinotracheale TaxID=28251 RepID=UPI00129CCFF5|nr:hypothetical protein [Ornithobacterium rhinotracheale]MRJ09767.1 hypothetical protein [Ornithobacterium rhinotracheale]
MRVLAVKKLANRTRKSKKANHKTQNEVLKFQRQEMAKVIFLSFPLAPGSKDCAVKCKITDILEQTTFAWGSSHREAFNNARRSYFQNKDFAKWTTI